jgi:hypothetical protein
MISFFRSPVRNPHPESQLNSSQVYNYIINPLYAELTTNKLRSIVDHDCRRQYKSQMFDYVTFSGQFTYRSASNFVRHTALFCFDFDHIESDEAYDSLRNALLSDELLRSVLLFRSPSGDGMKWVVESPVYDELVLSPNSFVRRQDVVANHKKIYEMLARYIGVRYSAKPDTTSDVSRACYLPYDPECFHQFPLGFPQPQNYASICEIVATLGQDGQDGQDGQGVRDSATKRLEQKPNSNDDVRWDDEATLERLVSRIENQHIDITADYNTWVKVGFAIANTMGAGGSRYFHRISQNYPRYDYNQTERLYASCLRSNNGAVTLGTIVYLIHNA